MPPKKSPMTFPMAAPHAPAGPNRNEQTTGTALAGRNSVTPGMIGRTLNGIRIAAYSDALMAVSTTMRVLLHILMRSRMHTLRGCVGAKELPKPPCPHAPSLPYLTGRLAQLVAKVRIRNLRQRPG